MRIHIEPLKLPLSSNPEDHLGEIRLRLYQAQLRRCDQCRILLEAPTSSGKTLAYLIRAIESRGVKPRFGTTLIIYPTNALIWDQARSLRDLIYKLGKKTNITVESNLDIVWRREKGNADIDLYVLNGETLAALSQESKSTEGKSLVKRLRSDQAEARIILSNPEILYYVFLYKFARNEELLDSIFNRNPPNLLIFDEFHLYHGYALATMTYMLAYMKNYFDQIIFSSATPIEVGSIIHENYRKIVAEPSDEGDIVKHPMDLDLESVRGILSSEEIPKIKDLVSLYLEKNKNRPQIVKVLLIISSVITCVKIVEALEKEFPNQVTAIHGLVPSSLRPRSKSDFKPIVIGTSAIEVGIDFDTSSLIFEAHDSSSFLQRIGRGARHSRCDAAAFIPALHYPRFRKALSRATNVKSLEFSTITRHILPDLPSYSSFPMSPQAVPIMVAILLNWTMQRSAGGRRLNDGETITETKLQLERDEFNIPEELAFSKGKLLELCEKAPKYGILKMARKMSCRSSMDSIPAFFRSAAQFDLLSLNDLSKVQFNIITVDDLKREGIKIPWRMRFVPEFIQVNGIKQRQEKIKIVFELGRFEETPAPLTNFSAVADDHDIEEKICQILKGQPSYILFNKEDWRFPGFFTAYGDFLAIGGDSYLAWFLRQSAPKTDKL
jgi:CRISPR-associated helicase Cas3